MSRHLSLFAGAAFTALVAATAPGFAAQPAGSTATPAPTSVMAPDLAFVLKAAQGGMEEVALGGLAQEKASNEKVKKFGEHMVMDHTKANADLMKIAEKKGIQLPDNGTDAAAQMVAAALSQQSGMNFDMQYVAQQVAGHETMLTLFRFAADHAMDADLRAFAKKYEPAVAEHLKEATALMKMSMKQASAQ